jgi:hypothetical protein
MNAVKTLALVASTIGFANIGLSLPAHSQQVASNQAAAQTAIVIGNNNVVNQTNILVINNRGRFNNNSYLPSTTRTTQAAEIQGDSNRINQASDARIDNSYPPQGSEHHSENGHRHHQGSERHGENGHHRNWQH